MRSLFKIKYLKSGSTNQQTSFFPWKFGVLSFIWLWFHVNIQISLGMAGIWKKCPKSWVSPLSKVGQFSAFSTFWKNAWLRVAVVSKSLNPQKTKGYQLKDNVHTFHLIPSGTLCDHWSGHRDALKTGPILYKNFFLQRVDGFPYVEASMSLPNLLPLPT